MNRTQKRILREIDRRIQMGPPVSGSEERARFRSAVRASNKDVGLWIKAHGKVPKGYDGLGNLSIDEIDRLLSADAWCRAWRRSMETYLDTFGITGAKEESPA